MKLTLGFVGTGLLLLLLGLWVGALTYDPARAADEAYRRGDYAVAVEKYAEAAAESPDPERLAFNQAAALYRLRHFGNADQCYQSAGEHGADPRPAQADYDRGNCAFQEACTGGGSPDQGLLAQAAEHYRNCLRREQNTTGAGSLFADARHNLELAKLLQAPAAPSEQQRDSARDLLAWNDPRSGPPQEQEENPWTPKGTSPEDRAGTSPKEDLCPD
jgi:tetratricopeptide (TPR) repeat protein